MFKKFLEKTFGEKNKTNETQPPIDQKTADLINAIETELGGIDVTDSFSREKIEEDEKRRQRLQK